MEINYLKLYRGENQKINDHITIHIPTIDEITDMDDNNYYSIIYLLCSTASDRKWQLDDLGLNYVDYQDDYEFFINFTARTIPNEYTRIILGDVFDFSKMELVYDDGIKMNVLRQHVVIEKEIVIDNESIVKRKLKYNIPLKTRIERDEYIINFNRYVYDCIVSILRTIHGIKRSFDIPMNEMTRKILIEDSRDDYLIALSKTAKPILFPLISAMVNSEGFPRNDKDIFDMNIFAFMDSVMRINKIKNSNLLLQSAYSGFGVSLKDIKKEDLDWTGSFV